MMIVVGVADDDVDEEEETDDVIDDKTNPRCSEHIFRYEGCLLRV